MRSRGGPIAQRPPLEADHSRACHLRDGQMGDEVTLDGKTAAASGDSRWISSESSRGLVHELRGRMDAIVVGIGTVEADDPLLTARPPGPRSAARVVLDSSARLPNSSRLVQTSSEFPVIVAVNQSSAAQKRDQLTRLGCEVIAFPGQGRIPIAELLIELGGREMTHVLVEGGGQVLGSSPGRAARRRG